MYKRSPDNINVEIGIVVYKRITRRDRYININVEIGIVVYAKVTR